MYRGIYKLGICFDVVVFLNEINLVVFLVWFIVLFLFFIIWWK